MFTFQELSNLTGFLRIAHKPAPDYIGPEFGRSGQGVNNTSENTNCGP